MRVRLGARPVLVGQREADARHRGLNSAEVCEWAKVQGMDVTDGGRLPAEVAVKLKVATAK